MMDADALFVDTNVLIFATNTDSPWHNLAAGALRAEVTRGTELVASAQILREYLAAATRPGAVNLSLPAIIGNLQTFQSTFRVVDDTRATFGLLTSLVQTVLVAGRQIHDANIVATMQHYRVHRLLTHNVGDFARFSHLIPIVPLGAAT
jgi:predicted nucleic acid-binding protein